MFRWCRIARRVGKIAVPRRSGCARSCRDFAHADDTEGDHREGFDRVGKIAGSVVARPCAENAILPTLHPLRSHRTPVYYAAAAISRSQQIHRPYNAAGVPALAPPARLACRTRGLRRGGCAGRSFAYVSALRHAAAIQPAGAASVGAGGRGAAVRRRDIE